MLGHPLTIYRKKKAKEKEFINAFKVKTPGLHCEFSECRNYRYTWALPLNLSTKGTCAFIGLNPSTADEEYSDPTVKRCVKIARDLNFQRFVMLNLFAYRSTDPKNLRFVGDPIGPDNDAWILQEASAATMVVAAWGTNGQYRQRDEEVLDLLQGIPLYKLALTQYGFPHHPLYLKDDIRPTLWNNG